MIKRLIPSAQVIRRSLIFMLSFASAIALFWVPSFTHTVMAGGVFCFASLPALRDKLNASDKSRSVRLVSALLTVIVLFYGIHKFMYIHTFTDGDSRLAFALAEGRTQKFFALSLVLFACGFYSVYKLALWCTSRFLELLPKNDKSPIYCLKSNWYLPASAVGFLIANYSYYRLHMYALSCLRGITAILIPLIIITAAASRLPSVTDYIRKSSMAVKIVSALTAVGFCCCSAFDYGSREFLPRFPDKSIGIIFPVCSVVSLAFVFVCLVYFWNSLLSIFSRHKTFVGITAAEAILYSVLFVGILICTAVLFNKSDAFYGSQYWTDLIFTSDSPSIVKNNAYMVISHGENDIRQPLFAVFAMPFSGIPYLIGRAFGLSATVRAILLNSTQIALLFVTNFLLARMMKLDSLRRCFFMLFMCSSFTFLLFSVMMEQYIVACFWLILAVYLISEDGSAAPISVFGAGGSLLTSLILFPFTSDKSPVKDFRRWLDDMYDNALKLLVALLVFCRFDIVSTASHSLILMRQFSGNAVSLSDRLRQYTVFIKSCFVAHDGDVANIAPDLHYSWQMLPVSGYCIIGIAILIIALLGVVINKKNPAALLGGGWIIFSALILVIVGWGSAENGMVLYSPYFCWAFTVPIFMLVCKIEGRLRVRFILPAFCVVCSAVMLIYNIPALAEIIKFAAEYYPV